MFRNLGIEKDLVSGSRYGKEAARSTRQSPPSFPDGYPSLVDVLGQPSQRLARFWISSFTYLGKSPQKKTVKKFLVPLLLVKKTPVRGIFLLTQ